MKDMERTYERYAQMRQKRGLPGTIDRNEWGAIQAKMNEEYGIKKEKYGDWFEKLQDGWKPREGKFVRNRPKEKKPVEAAEATASFVLVLNIRILFYGYQLILLK